MPIPGDRQHKLPQPTEGLPELSPAEAMYLQRMGRLAKAGLLKRFTIEPHDKKDALDADWTIEGGGRLLK